MTEELHEIQRFEPPLPEELIGELTGLWQAIFAEGYHHEAGVLTGAEKDDNDDVYYLIRAGSEVVATAHLTVSRTDPRLGGVGEVATIQDYRGRGLAQKLCARAADEFEKRGGQALFLGTGNPVAARVYGRVGWRHVPNSNVMLRVTGTGDPQEYVRGYYSSGAQLPVEIVEGSPGQRIGMIPLIVHPNEWVALDANTGLFSTRVRNQPSCMGLYPKYKEIESVGTWFAARRRDGAIVGLASVKRLTPDGAQVDAFAQTPQHLKATSELYRRAIEQAALGGGTVRAVCAERDTLKQSILDELGFRPTGQAIEAGPTDDPIEWRAYEIAAG